MKPIRYEKFNESIKNDGFEIVIKRLPTKNSHWLNVFSAEFYQAFKDIITIFINYSTKYQEYLSELII
jgi:hypothetical protein